MVYQQPGGFSPRKVFQMKISGGKDSGPASGTVSGLLEDQEDFGFIRSTLAHLAMLTLLMQEGIKLECFQKTMEKGPSVAFHPLRPKYLHCLRRIKTKMIWTTRYFLRNSEEHFLFLFLNNRVLFPPPLYVFKTSQYQGLERGRLPLSNTFFKMKFYCINTIS